MEKRVSILISMKSGDIHSITTVSSPCIKLYIVFHTIED